MVLWIKHYKTQNNYNNLYLKWKSKIMIAIWISNELKDDKSVNNMNNRWKSEIQNNLYVNLIY
jgi:hypothetical protein